MRNIFNMENPVWQFIGRLIDVVVLNFLWFICCIPIVTFGPATVSLHYSLMKTVKGENTKYVRNFFKTMKENMSSAIPVGLIMLIIGALIVYSILFYQVNAAAGSAMMFLKWFAIGFGIIWLFTFQWVWALSSRFVNTTFQTIKNALLLSLGNFPWTLLMIVILLIPAAVLYFANFIPILIFGYGLVVYLDAYILNHVLDPIIKKAKEEQGLEVEEDDEEGRYSEEEMQAMSQWHIPKELSDSGYSVVEKETEEVNASEKPETEEKE